MTISEIIFPKPTYIKVTVEEIYEALKKNGFEHLRGVWYKGNGGDLIAGGCVLQQGAMNLGVATIDSDASLYSVLNRFIVSTASKWSEHPATKFKLSEMDRGAGSVIVRWNDAYNEKDKSWVLPTYEDVIAMAYEVLRPFFKKTVKLETHEWNFKRKD